MTLAAGIDVSLRRGLDVVILDAARQVAGAWRRVTVDDVGDLLVSRRPGVVAVDAPCRWAPVGGRRKAELELAALGVRCFWTPSPSDNGHPFHAWMHVGMAVHQAVEAAGIEVIEVFPHASAVALAGWRRPPPETRSPGARRRWRAGVLAARGVDTTSLRSLDAVDAALAALTAAMAITGECFRIGDPAGGWITLPGCRPVVE